ncbi:MAG TPA: hypothetical protein VF190_12155, partial [Rhodothermales bacterium]
MTFVAAVSLVGAIQGALLLVALRRIEPGHRLANNVLSVFVGLVVMTLVARIIRDEGRAIVDFYPQVLLLMDTPVYSYGPLLFLYLYALTRPNRGLPRWWGLHFLPVALHLLRQSEYYLENRADFFLRLQQGNFPFWRWILMGAVVQMWIYLALSLRLAFGRRDDAADRHAHATYMKMLLLVVATAWTAWGYHGLS